MKKLFVKEVVDKIGKEVELYGWVHNKRDHKQIVFLDLRDRSGIVQIIGDVKLKDFMPEDVVYIKGIVKERPKNLINPKLKTGTVEIEAKEVKVIAKAANPPIDMTKEDLNVNLPTLLDYRVLTLRHPKISAIFKIQEKVVDGFRKIAEELGCVEVFVPQIAANATEGGAEVFKVNYYDHQVSLTQSPQLYKQMMVPIFERVYTIAHAYRAEPSVTTRHLSETIQLDCEFGFVDFNDLLDLLEKVGTTMVKHVEAKSADELKQLGTEKITYGKIPRLTLKQAQEIIQQETGRRVVGEDDLAPEDEIDICKWALKKHQSDFVTITHFPTQKRAFYSLPDPQNPEISLSYDLLFKGLEVASGSQRINNYKQLIETLKQRGLKAKEFEMYLMAFRFGMPEEGGFSFGLERMTKAIIGLANIREASLFPRDMQRVDIRLSSFIAKKSKK